MNDTYQELSKYYDEFVQKNRDYSNIAHRLRGVFGRREKLLDIGIGTGIVVEHLLKLDADYSITGVDNSPSLLDLAGEKLGETVPLHCQSVSALTIDTTFDVAYSRGGAWTFVRDAEGEVCLASHILDLDEIGESFVRVCQHLNPDGLLVISASNAYGDNHVELDNNIVHVRTAKTEHVGDAMIAVLDYRFYRGEDLLGQQILKLRLLNKSEYLPLLQKAGFTEEAIADDEYYTYKKKL